jgi:phosphoribosylamine--glycine ligase
VLTHMLSWPVLQVSSGGRVLGVTATGKDILEAQQKAYAAVDQIHFPDGFCRRDIGWRAVARLRQGA